MRTLLQEDKVSDYIKRLIINNSAYDRVQLATNVNELPDDLKKALRDGAPSIYNACSNHNQNLLAYLRLYFLSYFDISHGKGPVEYAMGLARIAIGELGMFKRRNSDSDLSRLKVCVLFLHNSDNQELKSKFDALLNGLSYQELTSQLDGARREFNRKNRDTLSQMAGDASEYTVVPISSFEEASKYGQYTSWCVTHGSSHFQSYIDGGRRFYFCLRKGFEGVPKAKGEGCPLDEYGLSMISVLVDAEGEPNYITTRWNHENDGENNENLRTAKQLQRVTGINFYATFKPYTLEELRAMGVTPLYAVQDLLDQGVDPEEIFDRIGDFSEGYAQVKLNSKWNFIDTQGKLVSPNQWFDNAGIFLNGYARIRLSNKYNFIDTQGKLLFPNQWFDGAGDFYDGYAPVKLSNKWNFIDTQGKLVSPNQWFDAVGNFSESYARIKLNDKWNFINTQGKLLFPNQWFDYVGNFLNGYAVVILNNKWNYIDTQGKLVSPNQWFDYVEDFSNGYAIVKLNNKYNFIDTKGKLVSPNQWFDYVDNFSDGYAIVGLNNKYNLIDTQGKLVSPNLWFDVVYNFSDGYARVKLNNKWNFIDTQGKLLFPNQWFDAVGNFSDGYAPVKLSNKWNYIDTQGKLVSPNQWFDGVRDFHNGYAKIELNNKWHKIGTEGNIEAIVNEHTVVITKSDLRKIVLECVEKIRNIS